MEHKVCRSCHVAIWHSGLILMIVDLLLLGR